MWTYPLEATIQTGEVCHLVKSLYGQVLSKNEICPTPTPRAVSFALLSCSPVVVMQLPLGGDREGTAGDTESCMIQPYLATALL